MSTVTDTVIIRGGGGSSVVVGSPDVEGIEAFAPGASIRVTGRGAVSVAGSEPASKAELADAFQNVTSLKVVNEAGNQVGSVTVGSDGRAVAELNGTDVGETLDHLAKMSEIRTLMEIDSPIYSSLEEFGAAHGEDFVNGDRVYAANMAMLPMAASDVNYTVKRAFIHVVLNSAMAQMFTPKLPNADATFVFHGNTTAQGVLHLNPTTGGIPSNCVRSLTAIFQDMTYVPVNGFFNTYNNSVSSFDAFPIRLYMPKVTTSFGNGRQYGAFHFTADTSFTRAFRDIKTYAPVMNKASYFYARGMKSDGLLDGFAPPLSAESVAYLFTYLPTVTGSPTMHTAIAKNVLISATQAEVDAGLAANIGDKCPQAGTPLGDATKSMLTKGWLVDFDESDYE